MASSSWLVWLLAAAAIAAAEDYLVGGTTGWNLSYPIGWPEGKTFKVGDNPVFDYPKGQYTVTEVDSETLRECYRQGNTINEWASGHDVVALEKAGRRWFFSSLANHCDLGLEHVVNVAGGGARVPVAPGRHLIVRLILLRRLRSPVAVPPAIPPVSPGPAPGAPPPPSPETSSVTFNHCKIDEAAVAWAAVVAGAVVAAAFV